MASEPQLIAFASPEAMASRVADIVAAQLQFAACNEGRGDLAVSGGSTPKLLYQEIAQRRLDWDRIALTLVDERWVSAGDERSNESFIRAAFRQSPVKQIFGLYNGAPSAKEAVADIALVLSARKKPIDVAILGMGPDGHTASWFPHADGLDAALTGKASVCAIHAKQSVVTGANVERMTLTCSTLKEARIIILLIAGDEKRLALDKALQPGPVEDMPVRAILRARPDLWVCWAP